MDPLGTLTETLTPRTGTVRLRLTPTGRVLLVGPFASLGGARQLARRLRPQAGKTSGKKEKAVDRLILAARHVLALSRLLLLIGCATPSALISVDAEQGARLTEAQQLVDRAWETQHHGGPTPQVRLYPGTPIEGGEFSLRRSIISLTALALMGREWRAVLGHETRHALLGHDGHCGPPCEIAADRMAVQVMSSSWGMARDEATFQVCTVLVGASFEAVNSPPAAS